MEIKPTSVGSVHHKGRDAQNGGAMGSRTVIAILVATFLVSTCSASPSKSVSLVGAGELCDLYYAISLTDGRCNGNEKIPVPCDGWCAAYIQCKDGVPETKGTDCTWLNNYFDPNKKKCTFNMWRNCDWYKSLTMPPTTTSTTEAVTTASTEEPTTPTTAAPTTITTEEPTTATTEVPTTASTQEPSTASTEEPTSASTEEPTTVATEAPATLPTDAPTTTSTEEPSTAPTEEPTTASTEEPTTTPTEEPTSASTEAPATEPTDAPTTTSTEELKLAQTF
ncbi:mucin-5AC-like [Frankliniella occidentalis]|uniref:Mucin-5AC-like n=1 Tax=Frankliniella occidentalis TaxID=133901 RepID=A0A9C6X151_FRAOC|nr:mucin-5AC-like [Frankliniella occidentalis]